MRRLAVSEGVTLTMGFVQRRLVKLVMRVVSFPKLTLAICGVLLVAAVGLAWFGLSLSTDQDELLTPKLKFFRGLQGIHAAVSGK